MGASQSTNNNNEYDDNSRSATITLAFPVVSDQNLLAFPYSSAGTELEDKVEEYNKILKDEFKNFQERKDETDAAVEALKGRVKESTKDVQKLHDKATQNQENAKEKIHKFRERIEKIKENFSGLLRNYNPSVSVPVKLSAAEVANKISMNNQSNSTSNVRNVAAARSGNIINVYTGNQRNDNVKAPATDGATVDDSTKKAELVVSEDNIHEPEKA